MRKTAKRSWMWLASLAAVATWAALPVLWTGCEDDDFDHDPPPGKGTLYVDNQTWTEIKVYVDGTRMGKVDRDETKYYDLSPGRRHVLLDEEDGRREWHGYVHILEGRRVILTVETDWEDDDEYDVDLDED